MQVVSSDADVFGLVIGDVCLDIILNPNKGANKHIYLPASSTQPNGLGNASDTGLNTGADLISSVGLQPGAEMTIGFDCKEVAIRGDDFPNLGGIQIVPPGAAAGGLFSIKTKFIYPVASSTDLGGSCVITHHFDLLADLADYSYAANQRN
jgi:hypothetical protein